jgi:hypothetical protein
LELQETNARLVATRNGIEPLNGTILDLESEVPIHSTDLVVEKLRGEGKVNKAPAEVHAEYNQKTMSSNTPRSGSRSHDI